MIVGDAIKEKTMGAAQFGEFIGVFFAAGGIGFIWLGFLWLIRVYKRWPKGSYISAAFVAALIGLATALNGDFILTMTASLLASGYIVWRGLLIAKKKVDGEPVSRA